MKLKQNKNIIAPIFDETLEWDEYLGRTNLYTNGSFELGSTYNFGKTLETSDPHSGSYYITQNNYHGWQSSEYVPVDTSKEYEISVWVKTIQRSAANSLAGGHIGFACYDKNKTFIDLRNNGGVGNTYLSRAASPGDSVIYISSNSDWYTGSDVTNYTHYFRQILFFPASHPDYGTPHGYTRFNGMRYSSLVQTAQGDWAMTLENGTLPNYGYSLPSGTPVSRGVAGGTYNYAFGNPNYPETWTQYKTTIPANIEIRNSDNKFRIGTKYIKFLILGNYNIRNQSAPLAKFGLDDIALTCVSDFQGNDSSYSIKMKDKFSSGIQVQELNEVDSLDTGVGAKLTKQGKIITGGEFIEE